ncbi:unnamed protein product [Trichobilharzia regenti]|nr:unnamed protein product [Trichobilharzia regenti]
MTSSVDVKPMNVSGRTISLHCNGFNSPSQLCSPAPVRSGKTPISPDAVSESCSPVSPEHSDEENHRIAKIDLNCTLRRKQSKRRPHLSVQSTNLTTNPTNTEHSKSQNNETTKSKQLSNSFNAEFVLRKEADSASGRLPRYIRVEQDKDDEEFLSRMHARPLSIAVDSISQLNFYTVKLTEDNCNTTTLRHSPSKKIDNCIDNCENVTSSNDVDDSGCDNSPENIIFIKSHRMCSSEVS